MVKILLNSCVQYLMVKLMSKPVEIFKDNDVYRVAFIKGDYKYFCINALNTKDIFGFTYREAIQVYHRMMQSFSNAFEFKNNQKLEHQTVKITIGADDKSVSRPFTWNIFSNDILESGLIYQKILSKLKRISDPEDDLTCQHSFHTKFLGFMNDDQISNCNISLHDFILYFEKVDNL